MKKAEVDRLHRRLDALGAAARKSPQADREAEVEAALKLFDWLELLAADAAAGRRSRACCGTWG